MKYAQLLIDKASKMCGSDKALAERMGIYPADVSHLRAGKRPLSPELAAELADIAGEDAREAAIHAIIERNAAGRKGHLLREILGKAVAAGVAAMLVFSYSGDSMSATKPIANDSTPYTSYLAGLVRQVRRQLGRLAQITAAVLQALRRPAAAPAPAL